jgi:hypothetical protein
MIRFLSLETPDEIILILADFQRLIGILIPQPGSGA